MRCISLLQPWASLVAIGAKQIETRSWGTAYRGPLAIHASKSQDHWPGHDLDGFGRTDGELMLAILAEHGYHYAANLPYGAVIATVRLVACQPTARLDPSEQERAFGDFGPGRFGWLLADIQRLPEPIPARGSLGLWEWAPPAGLKVA